MSRRRPALAFLIFLALLVSTTTADLAATVATPEGFTPFLEVLGSGVQIYKCRLTGSSFTWNQTSARARLFPLGTKNLSKANAIGTHYFLKTADALGGRPSWSFKASTVTGRVNGSIASSNPANIAELLLQATSHSGTGPLSSAAYIQRLKNQGGIHPAASLCSSRKQLGSVARIPYQSHYVFSSQDSQPPATDPTAPDNQELLVGYFGEGFQHYRFNGSDWVLFNATAGLFVQPGGSQVGIHYFLPHPDAAKGQPTFELFRPASSVTAKSLQAVPASSTDIAHVLLQATSSSGSKYGFERVSYVRRLSTRGGVAPPVTRKDSPGDVFLSAYSAVYWFYAPKSH